MRISDWSSDVCSSDLGNIGGRHALDRARNLQHFGRASDHAAKHAIILRPHIGKAQILLLQRMNMEGARNDQAELIDVERLLVKVIGAAGNGTERAFPRAMPRRDDHLGIGLRSEEHTSELQSLMRISYAVS